MQVRQVLVTTTLKHPTLAPYDAAMDNLEPKETRLVYVPKFQVETASMQDLIEAGKISKTFIDEEGNEQEKDANKFLHEFMAAADEWTKENAAHINEKIEKQSEEFILDRVKKYYGDRFISVEVHRTIAIEESIGSV